MTYNNAYEKVECNYRLFAFFLKVFTNKQSSDGHSQPLVDEIDTLLPSDLLLCDALQRNFITL